MAKTVVQKQEDRFITNTNIVEYGNKCIKTYATEVNLDRAVPDIYDGFKPVQRRIVWAMSFQKRGELVKTARVTGNVMGGYHPHGDIAISGAIETMVHQNTSLIQGTGNWGGLLDSAASARYTNCTLSNFGWSCFDPDYVAVTDCVPNYDGKGKEPVCIPVTLPVVLLNGSDGIGVGITTKLPTFTTESVVEVLTYLFSGNKLSYSYLAKTLKPALKWGGRFVNSKVNREQWLLLMKTGRAQIYYDSRLDVDYDHKKIIISEWPPGLSPDKFIKKVRLLPECARAYNSKGSTTFTIECRREYNAIQFESFVNKVQKMTLVKQNYRMNVTHRTASVVDGVTTFTTEFLSLGVGELIMRWARLRLSLEDKSLAYRISKQNGSISYTKLLIYACNHLSIIFESLKTLDPASYLTEHLKITKDQANQILELKVRQLSKLDKKCLQDKLEEQLDVLKQLTERRKNPKPALVDAFNKTMQLVLKDRQINAKRLTATFSVH